MKSLTMEKAEYRKYILNKIILVLFINFMASYDGRAIDLDADIYEGDSFVTDINYTYQLYTNEKGKTDCSGELNISVKIPQDAEALLYERTIRHSHNPHAFLTKNLYKLDNDSMFYVSSPNVYWNIYFRLAIYYKDGHREFSPTYSVRDYIRQEDLQLLEEQTAIDNAQSDSVGLEIQNGALYINTSYDISLSVVDILGRELFYGQISEPTTIPLTGAASSIVIVRYTDSNTTTTKKLRIR